MNRDGRAAADGPPRISVVVPAFASRQDLGRCLTGLAASEYRDFEVIVVDDGSSPSLEPTVRRFGTGLGTDGGLGTDESIGDGSVRVLETGAGMGRGLGYLRLDDGPRGPARARNRGVVHARGEWLVLVDSDCVVHPDTLGRFAAFFDAHPEVDSVFGSYDDAPAAPGFVSQYRNLLHHYVHHAARGEAVTFWAGCGAIRRSAFLAVGGFDEARFVRPSIEDIELGGRLHAAGHALRLEPSIQCTHLKRWSLGGVIQTDIRQRGIPWTRLMLERGGLDDTLNVEPIQRLSVLAMGGAVLAGMIALARPGAAWVALALLALVVWWNRDLYRFYGRVRGTAFAIGVLPLHGLYFLYCGVAAGLGWLAHQRERTKTTLGVAADDEPGERRAGCLTEAETHPPA